MPKNRNRFDDDMPEDEVVPDWALPETHVRAIGLLNEVIRMTPRTDPRLDHLLLLRHQLETDENQLDEAKKVISEFEEAYEKLTSPANRIGVFLGHLDDGNVQIALGDQEYIAMVDPKMCDENERVRRQEAGGRMQEAGGTKQRFDISALQPSTINHKPSTTFNIGTRVKVNDAFCVIGDLGYHPGGPLVKVN